MQRQNFFTLDMLKAGQVPGLRSSINGLGGECSIFRLLVGLTSLSFLLSTPVLVGAYSAHYILTL